MAARRLKMSSHKEKTILLRLPVLAPDSWASTHARARARELQRVPLSTLRRPPPLPPLLPYIGAAPPPAVEARERELLVRGVHLVVVEPETHEDARQAVGLLERRHHRDRAALADQRGLLGPRPSQRADRGLEHGVVG